MYQTTNKISSIHRVILCYWQLAFEVLSCNCHRRWGSANLGYSSHHTKPTLESFCDSMIINQDNLIHLGVLRNDDTSIKSLVAQQKDKSKHPKKKHPSNNKKNSLAYVTETQGFHTYYVSLMECQKITLISRRVLDQWNSPTIIWEHEEEEV